MATSMEKLVSKTARVAWPVFQSVNRLFPESKGVSPAWSGAPVLKSYQKVKPKLGWPRETDSLCPECVKELRQEVFSDVKPVDYLRGKTYAEIKANIVEKEGQIWMIKDCPKHGHFEDIMSIDARFLERMESLFPGSDYYAPDKKLRNHGSSSIKYGRGSVLTIDLTNRCNMMCEPCFMDANQVGYVHELEFAEIRKILDDAITIKPKRQLSVQFSGGEPTMSPLFIESIKYAKKVGYFSVQAATNGIKFAQDPSFAQEAYDAGMRIAYLQFDGVGNENHEHRKIGNLFDVKLKAIENLYNAGIDVVLVVTLVNTVNDHQVGAIFDFAIQNSDKITFISFQPVSFTGRDEDITNEERFQKRYTLSHLAHDFKKQAGFTEPLRDWFPLSAVSVFSDFNDIMKGLDSEWGSLKCGCHPNCGVGTAFFVNKKTKEKVALGEIMDIEQLLKDVALINDMNRGQALSKTQIAMALLRNYKPEKAPKSFSFADLIKKFDKQTGGSLGGEYGQGKERKNDTWLLMFVAGMWFQDLWNYDFKRTERCIIPYGTQEGEISFCAYNTGVGWRNIIENKYQNASVGEWYKQHGRHEVYANNKPMELPSFENTLQVPGLPDYEASAKVKSVSSTNPNSVKAAVGFDV